MSAWLATMTPALDADVTREFARKVYHTAWQTKYRGIPTVKYPCDLWIYQEIIHEVQPDLIIETGTWKGGSALFLADLCTAMGKGRVLTIDIELHEPVEHPRLLYWHGNSLDWPGLSGAYTQYYRSSSRPEQTGGSLYNSMLVILDSDHRKEHVAAELEHFAPYVSVGSYLIVEDTNIAGHPIEDYTGDPMAAVQEFLPRHPEFQIDHSRERYIVTQNPSGYLRRVK